MLSDLARALDPCQIAVDCGLTLDEWQASLMRSTASRVLMCCARQTGKSTTAALVAIATAQQPNALVLLVSPSQRQSAELFRSLMVLYRRLPNAPEIRSESVLRVELVNGSRIVALPGESNTVRGYSGATLVVVDEGARVEPALWAAVRPMLATSNGRLICLSTPFGKNNYFYEAWHGDESWHRVRVSADQCPRISKDFLEEELRELGEQRFAEEYRLEFLEDGDQVIRTEFFDRAISTEFSRLWQ
jgi:Terminase large subunit, T4likevirus-type, N-terminal